MDIKIALPGKDKPGYLRRQRKALQFSQAFEAKQVSPELLDGLVEFLVDFVVEPADRDQAKELLWDASEEQFTEVLNAISGSGESSVNPTK